MIEVRKAKKYYNRFKRNQITAIDNTTLTFGDSGLVAILGNSGCGKTTLLNMIGGLDRPDSGRIYVNGKNMNSIFSGHTDNIRNRNIGYIFQNYHLIDDMTVFDNVALVLRMLGVRNRQQLRDSVYYVLEKVGLYRYRNRPAAALSGGERQRVGIARAIVKNPGIIIADEPTGNLDSGNSLEVMNIIKTISKEKLVILVTHERELAEFYADRIIEIVDGKVVDDRLNEHDNALDYRVENKLYLQDFDKQSSVSADGVKMDFYSDGSADVDVKLVLRNGNLYIQCDGKKIEAVDEDSPIELVDDHYHALSKEEAERNDFDYNRLTPKKKRLRYHSIYNVFNLFVNGVKKVFAYPRLKKILLLGFVITAMAVMFAISNYLGVNTVTDDEFLSVNRNYLLLRNGGNTVDAYMQAATMPGVRYVLPGDSNLMFTLDYSDAYYQTNQASDQIQGSLSALSTLDPSDLIAGGMPSDDHGIVVDRRLIDRILKEGSATMVGYARYEDFIGKAVRSGEMKEEYVICGICDRMDPCIFTDDAQMIRLLMKGASGGGGYYVDYGGYAVMETKGVAYAGENFSDEENNNAMVVSIEDAKGELTLKRGAWPENDYECVVPYDYRYTYKIGKNIQGRVNGREIKVVGYYVSTSSDENSFFCNANTYFYKYLSGTSNLTIYPEEKDLVLEQYRAANADINDTYEVAKRDYMLSIRENVNTVVLISAIVLVISLVEIFLMLRSSFLSRVKEVGTLRAIGLKKGDVYKMFLGEILAILALTAPLGFFIMGYVLKTLTQYEIFAQQYVFDSRVILYSAAIVLLFDVIVGLLPVFFTLRKTPARILARTDVD